MNDAANMDAAGASVGKNAASAATAGDVAIVDVAVAEISIALTSLIHLGTHLGHLELLGH
jgi:hypothetical protein